MIGEWYFGNKTRPMRKLIALLCLTGSLLLGSQCSPQSAPPSEPATPGATYAPDDLISLRTTACFGRCPVYEFRLTGTGQATFTGKRFTDRLGNYTRTFSPAETRALFDAFARADYFAYKDQYSDDVTDLPNRYLTLKRGERTKKIQLYANVPEALVRLEQLVARAALETQGWQVAAEKM